MSAITEGEWRYNQLIKLFPSEAEPPFEDSEQLERWWGRKWGCTNDVGRLRVVLMHRPGEEINVVDTSKRLDNRAFGDTQAGWYWRGAVGPDLARNASAARRLYGLAEKRGRRGRLSRRDRRWPNEVLLHPGLLRGGRGRRNRHAVGAAHQARRRTRGLAHARETGMSHSSHDFRERSGGRRKFRLAEQQDGGHRPLVTRERGGRPSSRGSPAGRRAWNS